MTRLWRLITGTTIVLLVMVGTEGTASAHAQLESTSPSQSSVLLIPPHQVVLHFGEPVEIDFGSLRVIGPAGAREDSGGTHHPDGDSHAVATSLPSDLPRGTFVVAWRVISADSHPVHGAFVFSVGTANGAAKANALAASLTNQSGSGVVGAFYWLVRVSAFVGLLFLVGLGVVVPFVWREGGRSRRIGRVLWLSWSILLGATLVGIAIQGVYAAALPLTDIYRPSLINAVLHTRFGEIQLVRVLLLVAMVPVILGIQDRLGRGSRRWAWVMPSVILLGIGLLLTPGLAGHASTGNSPGLGLALDFFHLAASALWLGGLALLATFLVPKTPGDSPPTDPVKTTLQVSSIAFSAVVVVVATGVFQSIRQVGSFYALFHTVYGRTLLVKIGLVVILVAVGALSRRIVHGTNGHVRRTTFFAPRRQGVDTHPPIDARVPEEGWGQVGGVSPTESDPAHRSATAVIRRVDAPVEQPAFPLQRLRHSVLTELAIALAVLAVTALLVNAVPAQQAAAQPFSYSFTTLGDQVNTIVAPARAGVGNQVHVYVLNSAGAPTAIPEMDASISLPSQSIGPLVIPLVVGGVGHYYATNFDIPIAGTWILKLTVRTDAIDENVVTTNLPVH
jgi:copper transport protein